MWPNPQAADLVTFTEKILNGKLDFLCSVIDVWQGPKYVAVHCSLSQVKVHLSLSSESFKKDYQVKKLTFVKTAGKFFPKKSKLFNQRFGLIFILNKKILKIVIIPQIITMQKSQWSDWSNGVQSNC